MYEWYHELPHQTRPDLTLSTNLARKLYSSTSFYPRTASSASTRAPTSATRGDRGQYANNLTNGRKAPKEQRGSGHTCLRGGNANSNSVFAGQGQTSTATTPPASSRSGAATSPCRDDCYRSNKG